MRMTDLSNPGRGILWSVVDFDWQSRSARAAGPGTRGASDDDLVARMMAFDADKDGKLTKSEVTDERLLRLFDRVRRQQGRDRHQGRAAAVAKQEQSERPRARQAVWFRAARRFGPPGGGPGG